jgi:hypothetical protein
MKWLFVPVFFSTVSLLGAASVRLTLKDGAQLEGEAALAEKSTLAFSNAALGSTNIDLNSIRSARFHLNAAALEPTNLAESAKALPKGWTNADIGPVTIPGSVQWTDERSQVSGSGTRFWLPQPDEFQFVYRPFSGSGHLTAQITNSEAVIAGIMFRESLAPDSEFVAEAVTTSTDGLLIRSRRDRRYRELVHAEGDYRNFNEIRPPCWLKLIRRDRRFSICQSTDEGISWQIIHESPSDWGRTVYAGLFVVGGVTNAVKTATFANVQVEDEMDGRKLLTNKLSRVRLVLNDGSLLQAADVSADQTKIRFQFGDSNITASALSVCRIEFGDIPKRIERDLSSQRRGVLLKSGDFFEGDLSSIDRTQAKLSSVLFGTRTVPLDRVLAIIIAPPLANSAPFLIRTLDGSAIVAKTLGSAPDILLVNEPRLGLLMVPLAELAAIETDHAPRL